MVTSHVTCKKIMKHVTYVYIMMMMAFFITLL